MWIKSRKFRGGGLPATGRGRLRAPHFSLCAPPSYQIRLDCFSPARLLCDPLKLIDLKMRCHRKVIGSPSQATAYPNNKNWPTYCQNMTSNNNTSAHSASHTYTRVQKFCIKHMSIWSDISLLLMMSWMALGLHRNAVW